MNKRILIIGGVAGGASVAARARRTRTREQKSVYSFERRARHSVRFQLCSSLVILSGVVGTVMHW